MVAPARISAQSTRAPLPPQFSDSAAVAPAPVDTARAPRIRRTAPREKRFDAPRWVMVRSALLPGWGQLHNRAWLKAALVAGGEASLVVGMIGDTRELNRLEEDIRTAQGALDPEAEAAAVDAYNRRLDRRTARTWLLAGLLAYALTDAYVDAHFRNFDAEFEIPAPDGPSGASGLRFSARWHF